MQFTLIHNLSLVMDRAYNVRITNAGQCIQLTPADVTEHDQYAPGAPPKPFGCKLTNNFKDTRVSVVSDSGGVFTEHLLEIKGLFTARFADRADGGTIIISHIDDNKYRVFVENEHFAGFMPAALVPVRLLPWAPNAKPYGYQS